MIILVASEGGTSSLMFLACGGFSMRGVFVGKLVLACNFGWVGCWLLGCWGWNFGGLC